MLQREQEKDVRRGKSDCDELLMWLWGSIPDQCSSDLKVQSQCIVTPRDASDSSLTILTYSQDGWRVGDQKTQEHAGIDVSAASLVLSGKGC